MEHFQRVAELQYKNKEIERLLSAIKSLGFPTFDKKTIAICESDNGRSTLSDVRRIIGEEEMDKAIRCLELIIEIELYQVKNKIEAELNQYEIIKNTPLVGSE